MLSKFTRKQTREAIFRLFKEGHNYEMIAFHLNLEGHRTNRGTKFSSTRVQTFCNYHKIYRTVPGVESMHMFRLIQQPANI